MILACQDHSISRAMEQDFWRDVIGALTSVQQKTRNTSIMTQAREDIFCLSFQYVHFILETNLKPE